MNIKKYTDLGLSKIINSNLIDEKQIDTLAKHSKTLAHVYLHKQIYRTKTEMEMSVLNDVKFPFKKSKYWQAVRECDMMFKELVSESITYEETLAQLELKNIELSEINPDTKRSTPLIKLKNCEIKRLQFNLMEQKLKSGDRIREINEWCTIMNQLVKDDPTINIYDVNEHQAESYKRRFEIEMEIALKSQNTELYKSSSIHMHKEKN